MGHCACLQQPRRPKPFQGTRARGASLNPQPSGPALTRQQHAINAGLKVVEAVAPHRARHQTVHLCRVSAPRLRQRITRSVGQLVVALVAATVST